MLQLGAGVHRSAVADHGHRSMCYRSGLLVDKFNTRWNGDVSEGRFTKFSYNAE